MHDFDKADFPELSSIVSRKDALKYFFKAGVPALILSLGFFTGSCFIAYDNSFYDVLSETNARLFLTLPNGIAFLFFALSGVFSTVFLLQSLSDGFTRFRALFISTAIASFLGFIISSFLVYEVKYYEYRLAEKRLKPLIEAIYRFEKDHNKPPSQLSALVPKYIEKIPESGIPSSRTIQYLYDESGKTKKWSLHVPTFQLLAVSVSYIFPSHEYLENKGYSTLSGWNYLSR